MCSCNVTPFAGAVKGRVACAVFLYPLPSCASTLAGLHGERRRAQGDVMRKLPVLAFVALSLVPSEQAASQDAAAAAQPVRFAGTWVGTQGWAIENPPPGARDDQPVTLDLAVVDGRLTGTMKPFLGGEDGATLVDATIVGEELRATAIVGRPRPEGARRGGRGNWTDPIQVAFTFRLDGLNLTGTSDVKMGEVPWMKFKYDLSRKRSRY